MKGKTYRGRNTREISFPLGGIGSGSVGLSGNGMLIDWEIFNKPSKGSTNGYTHFAIKAESEHEVLDTRVLCGDLQPPFSGEYAIVHHGFGYGVKRDRMTGMPDFENTSFTGEFPVASIDYSSKDFPGSVTLTAFNPFIPLNDRDSSIPAGFFEFTINNTTQSDLTYSLAFSCKNPFINGTSVNEFSSKDGVKLIKLGTSSNDTPSVSYGDLTIATDADDVSYQEYWYRGKFFDDLGIFWQDFSSFGRLKNRVYNENKATKTLFGTTVYAVDMCTLAAHVKIPSGKSQKVRFVISWSFPNINNTWRPFPVQQDPCPEGYKPPHPVWKNYYASLFRDSADSARYCIDNFSRLYSETLEFKDSLFDSTLPDEVIEAVSANISTLKSSSCLRLEKGEFYSFEGCNCTFGSCEGSCMHVLNYAYALPFLFPKLERSLRDVEYTYNLRDSGGMSFRVNLPLGSPRWGFRACVDGQFGSIIKIYREWKISGDTEWLRSLWDKVKLSLEFAWSESNDGKWDLNRDGVLEGCQHHTLDMELFGPNAWLTGFYLAALKAAAEMADYLGDNQKSEEYSSLFEKGKAWVDKNLFNGEFYFHKIDLKDKGILEPFKNSLTAHGDPFEEGYWNSEIGELKYQIGEGCLIDQVIAQWHANNCGLGEIFDRSQTKTALESIYKYNFKKTMRNFVNPCRIYCLYDEAGTIICEWPSGKKPAVPAPYSQETFNGMEYQAACHMIQEGFINEGLEIVRAVRDRYDGEKRNPWSEFESGSNYVRSMSSYSLLNAFSGFEFHMAHNMIGFSPVWDSSDSFKCVWSLGSGWGHIIWEKGRMTMRILGGHLDVKIFNSNYFLSNRIVSVKAGNEEIPLTQNGRSIVFDGVVSLDRSRELQIEF